MKALLVDDHALFSEGFALLMGQAFDGITCLQAASLAEALACAREHSDIGLALVDLGLPDSRGMAGLAALREALPAASLVVLSADDAPQTVLNALDAGAQGFIPKSARAAAMREALGRVLAGEIQLPAALLQAQPPAPPGLAFSERQLDVLRLLVAGRANKEIGRELGLTESTVKTHLAALFRKLEVTSRTQAVVKTAALGLRLGR